MNGKQTFLVVGLIVTGLVGLALSQVQQNNQIVPPIPGAAQAPVIPQLPDLVADLKAVKTACEGRVRLLKRMAHERRLSTKDLDNAEQRYIAVKATHDACLSFLEAGLRRRFRDDDPQKIAQRMQQVNGAMIGFASWVDSKINQNVIGAAGPLGEALDHLGNWLGGISRENETAINQLVQQMRECTLADWDAIR